MGGEQLLKRKERVWHSAQTALLKATMARQKEKQKGITQTTHTSVTRFTCITCIICITCIKCIILILLVFPFYVYQVYHLYYLYQLYQLYYFIFWKSESINYSPTDSLTTWIKEMLAHLKNMQEHSVGSICMSQRLSCLRDLRAKINRQNRKVISHIDMCENLIQYKGTRSAFCWYSNMLQ